MAFNYCQNKNEFGHTCRRSKHSPQDWWCAWCLRMFKAEQDDLDA